MDYYNLLDCRLSLGVYRESVYTQFINNSNIYFPFDFLIVIFVILHAIILGTFDKTSKIFNVCSRCLFICLYRCWFGIVCLFFMQNISKINYN